MLSLNQYFTQGEVKKRPSIVVCTVLLVDPGDVQPDQFCRIGVELSILGADSLSPRSYTCQR